MVIDEDEKLEQTLRKEISREQKEDMEIVKNHVIKKRIFYRGDIDFLNDLVESMDYPEQTYLNGIYVYFDGEVTGLDITKFLEYVQQFLEDHEDHKDDYPEYLFFQGFKELLEPYKDYEIWFTHNEEDKEMD